MDIPLLWRVVLCFVILFTSRRVSTVVVEEEEDPRAESS